MVRRRSGRVLPAVVAVGVLLLISAATFYLIFFVGPDGSGVQPERPPEVEEAIENETSGAAEVNGNNTTPGILVTIKEPEVEHWKDDRVQWKLEADEVESHTGTGMTEFRGARGKFFREEELMLEFRSPLATFDESERRATAGGGIEGILTAEGYTLRAGRLEWVEKEDLLTMDDGVGLDLGGGNGIAAGRVEVTGDMTKFRFLNGVEIELVVR